jgi:hypothetical protein
MRVAQFVRYVLAGSVHCNFKNMSGHCKRDTRFRDDTGSSAIDTSQATCKTNSYSIVHQASAAGHGREKALLAFEMHNPTSGAGVKKHTRPWRETFTRRYLYIVGSVRLGRMAASS